jgi:hypothetical protein
MLEEIRARKGRRRLDGKGMSGWKKDGVGEEVLIVR